MKTSEDDKETRLTSDLAMAAHVCREILEGHPQALSTVYDEYQLFFHHFVAKRINNADYVDVILQDFWVDLLDGKDICGYQAQNSISLRSYLTRRLYFRTIDAYRKNKKHAEHFVSNDTDDNKQLSDSPKMHRKDMVDASPSDDPNRWREKIVNTALDLLSEIRPDDAILVRYLMEGRTYDEIAVCCGAVSESEIRKKSAALRQQFARKGTGAKARLQVIIERLAEKDGVKLSDILK